jgi:hypothetical protein
MTVFSFFSWFRLPLIRKYLFFSGSTEPSVVFLDYVIFFPCIMIFVSLLNTPPVELFGRVLLPLIAIIQVTKKSFLKVHLFQIVRCCYCYQSQSPKVPATLLVLPLCHHATVVMRTSVPRMVSIRVYLPLLHAANMQCSLPANYCHHKI